MKNRKDIFDLVLGEIKKYKDSLKISIENCKSEMIAAPSAMESHSDTTRAQVGRLVSNLIDQLNKIEQAEKIILEKKVSSSNDIITVGSLSEIDIDGKKSYIFLVPDGAGGLNLKDKINLSIVSEKSPLALAILGKNIGDTGNFKVNGQEKKVKILR